MVRQHGKTTVSFFEIFEMNGQRSDARRTPKTYYSKFGTPVCIGYFRVWFFANAYFFVKIFQKTENKRLSALETQYSGLSVIRQLSADGITVADYQKCQIYRSSIKKQPHFDNKTCLLHKTIENSRNKYYAAYKTCFGTNTK